MAEAIVFAIVGAESTGKTALAPALAERLQRMTALHCAWVPEGLRSWCNEAGRTPRQHEQAAIAQAQADAIEAAAAKHDVVLCDTTPLMIAVYSRMIFGDDSLIAAAAAWQRRCALTLLTSLDLPWQADGLQRDGPHVRVPVDGHLRALLIEHRLPWALISGTGEARIESAMDAVAPLLRDVARPGSGLFTRLQSRNDEPAARRWSCEHCDDPQCERQQFHARTR